MIIKDLLEQCPEEQVISAVLDLCGVDQTERDSVAQSYRAFLERLQQIQPLDTGHILLAVSFIDDGKERLDVPVYRKEQMEAIRFDRLCKLVNLGKLSLEELQKERQSLSLPDGYAFEFSPWEEVLGYELNIENAEEIGLPRLAAAVIYEMTFCGFTDEEVEAERQKLREAIEESEAVKKLPEEEQKKHFKSMEEVFAELGWQDKRTEEEKREDRHRMDSEIAENTRRLIRMFQKYGEPI